MMPTRTARCAAAEPIGQAPDRKWRCSASRITRMIRVRSPRRELRRADGDRLVAVDGAEITCAPGVFCMRNSSPSGPTRPSSSGLNDFAVNRTNLVRQQPQLVADPDVGDGNLFEMSVLEAVRDVRETFGQCLENIGGATHRVVLERRAAREHEHDNRADEVLAEQRCGTMEMPASQSAPSCPRARLRPRPARSGSPPPARTTQSGQFAAPAGSVVSKGPKRMKRCSAIATAVASAIQVSRLTP